MEVTYRIKQNIKYILCSVNVLNWADGKINGKIDDFPNSQEKPFMPLAVKEGDNWIWKPLIDIDEGKIVDWPNDIKATIYYEIKDVHIKLYDYDMHPVTWYDDLTREMVNEYVGYVPSILDCGGNSYSDYLVMNIDENGKIDCFDKEKIYQILTDEEE